MKLIRPILAVAAMATLAGCARFSTTQLDISYDDTGAIVREVRTVTRAGTFFDSNSALANLQTSQTDKTQRTEVGTLNQASTSASVSSIAEAITRGAVNALTPALAPAP